MLPLDYIKYVYQFIVLKELFFESSFFMLQTLIKVSECVCVCVNISNNGLGSRVFNKFKNFMQVDIDEVYTSTKA